MQRTGRSCHEIYVAGLGLDNVELLVRVVVVGQVVVNSSVLSADEGGEAGGDIAGCCGHGP